MHHFKALVVSRSRNQHIPRGVIQQSRMFHVDSHHCKSVELSEVHEPRVCCSIPASEIWGGALVLSLYKIAGRMVQMMM